jgi:hypothetical protein
MNFYAKNAKSKGAYIREFDAIRKKKGETVASYYSRFFKLAFLADIQDEDWMKEVYLAGLKPIALYEEVIDAIDTKKASLEQIHEIALTKEHNYFEKVERQRLWNEEEGYHKNKNSNNQNSNNQNNNNQSNKNNYYNKNTNKNTPKKYFEPCKFCGKTHNYKECADGDFKFYTWNEAEILQEIGEKPTPRKDIPKERITRETPWVKEKINKNNTIDKNTTNNTTITNQNNNISRDTNASKDNARNNYSPKK